MRNSRNGREPRQVKWKIDAKEKTTQSKSEKRLDLALQKLENRKAKFKLHHVGHLYVDRSTYEKETIVMFLGWRQAYPTTAPEPWASAPEQFEAVCLTSYGLRFLGWSVFESYFTPVNPRV